MFTSSLSTGTESSTQRPGGVRVTVVDDDRGRPPAVAFEGEPRREVSEGAAKVVLAVERIGPPTGAASVKWAVQAETAKGGWDFRYPASGELRWGDNEGGAKPVTIELVNDRGAEPDETFTVFLWEPKGVSLGWPGGVRVTVVDDDSGRLTLLAAPATAGTVRASPPPEVDGCYGRDTQVTVKATPASGYRFLHWTSSTRPGLRETQPEFSAQIQTDVTLTAHFELAGSDFSLAVETKPRAAGIVRRQPGSATDRYSTGTVVELTPEASRGYFFSHWEIEPSLDPYFEDPLRLTITSDLKVIAHFTREAGGTGAADAMAEPSILEWQIVTDGGVRWLELYVSGSRNPESMLERSADLVNWSTAGRLTMLDNGKLALRVPISHSTNRLFYRLVTPPQDVRYPD